VVTGVPELLPALRQDFALVVTGATGFSCNPSDIVQVIDRSGSMGFSGYMEPAKERAKQMVDLLQINDQAGVVRFDSSALEAFPLTLVNSETVKDDAHTVIDALTSSGNTDLREALELGLATLGPDTGRPRAIVFLSDGFHTVATPAIDDAFLDSLAAADVKVYTVALGPDSDFAVLNNIAVRTGTGAVRTVESAADLHKLSEIYYDILGSLGCGGVVHLASSTFSPETGLTREVAIASGAREALFALSWTAAEGRRPNLRLQSPGGTIFTPASNEVFNFRGSTHEHYRVNHPEPGTWRMLVQRGGEFDQPLSVTTAALSDAPVRWTVRIDPRYLIDGRILLILQADIAGRQLPGGRAIATLTYPTVSIPDLLRRHADELARIVIPPGSLNGDDKADSERLRLGMLATRLAAEGRDLYERKTLQIALTDDGENEDPKAGDGIYTGFFDPRQAGVAGNFSIHVDFEVDDPAVGRFVGHQILPVHVPEGGLAPSLQIGKVGVRKNAPQARDYQISVEIRKSDGQPASPASPADGVEVEMALRQNLLTVGSGPVPYTKASKAYTWALKRSIFLPGAAELRITATRNGLLAANVKVQVKM
jgi:hypothetical protein